MGFTDKFLKSLTDLFLGLHRIAIFYAILAPGLIVPVVAAFILGPLYAPAFFVPVGPLSIVVNAVIPFFGVSPLPAVPAYIALKVLVYLAIRRNKLLGVSAVWPPMIYFSILLLITLSGLLVEPTLELLLTDLVIALRVSTPLDLVTFSYVKFRDAVHGAEHRLWIPALAALWTAVLWPTPVIVIWVWRMRLPDLWTIILMSARTAITALQLLYIALFIRSRDALLLK